MCLSKEVPVLRDLKGRRGHLESRRVAGRREPGLLMPSGGAGAELS